MLELDWYHDVADRLPVRHDWSGLYRFKQSSSVTLVLVSCV